MNLFLTPVEFDVLDTATNFSCEFEEVISVHAPVLDSVTAEAPASITFEYSKITQSCRVSW